MNLKRGDIVKIYGVGITKQFCNCSFEEFSHHHLPTGNSNLVIIFYKKLKSLENGQTLYVFLYKNKLVGRIKYFNETKTDSLIDGCKIEKLL